MLDLAELKNPLPGWTLGTASRDHEHDVWTVSFRRDRDGHAVVVVRDTLEEAWAAARWSAEYYSRTASDDLTGPPAA